jgi:hypothetical protein
LLEELRGLGAIRMSHLNRDVTSNAGERGEFRDNAPDNRGVVLQQCRPQGRRDRDPRGRRDIGRTEVRELHVVDDDFFADGCRVRAVPISGGRSGWARSDRDGLVALAPSGRAEPSHCNHSDAGPFRSRSQPGEWEVSTVLPIDDPTHRVWTRGISDAKDMPAPRLNHDAAGAKAALFFVGIMLILVFLGRWIFGGT